MLGERNLITTYTAYSFLGFPFADGHKYAELFSTENKRNVALNGFPSEYHDQL